MRAYLKQVLRVPNTWIIFYFTCKYGIYFNRPHRKIYEKIELVKDKISVRKKLSLTSKHIILPATLRPQREEIVFNLPALSRKLSSEETYVLVQFFKNNKVLIKKVPFSPSKMRLDGRRIAIPLVKTPKEFLKFKRCNIELILNLKEYWLDRRETILDGDAKRLYVELKPLVQIPEHRLTYNLGQGDLDIRYNGKNVKIELTKMDFTKMRKSMFSKLIIGRVAINCLKFPDYIHIFVFHKKMKMRLKD